MRSNLTRLLAYTISFLVSIDASATDSIPLSSQPHDLFTASTPNIAASNITAHAQCLDGELTRLIDSNTFLVCIGAEYGAQAMDQTLFHDLIADALRYAELAGPILPLQKVLINRGNLVLSADRLRYGMFRYGAFMHVLLALQNEIHRLDYEECFVRVYRRKGGVAALDFSQNVTAHVSVTAWGRSVEKT